MRRPDLPSLVAGLGVVTVGVLLLLDQQGSVSLRFGVLAPIATAAAGAILVVLGLSRRT